MKPIGGDYGVQRTGSEPPLGAARTLSTRRRVLGLGAAATASLLADRAISPNSAEATETEVLINVKNYGATGNGSTDDTEAIRSAIVAIPADGGTIIFPSGTYLCSGSLDLHGRRSTILTGVGGLSAGATCASNLRFTGEGESFLNCRSTYGLIIQDLQIVATNSSFKGRLLDYSHDPTLETDSAYWSIERCYLQVIPTTTEGVCVFLDRAIDGTIEKCYIVGGQYGIRGVAASGHYANRIGVLASTFSGQGSAQIQEPGEAWSVQGNTFEALANGHAGAIALSFATPSRGVVVSGNWFGDVAAEAAGTQIMAGEGWEIIGNFIGGSTKTTGVEVPSATNVVVIHGNVFLNHERGITVGSTAADLDYAPNYFNKVTNPLPAATGVAEAGAGAAPTLTVTGSDAAGRIVLIAGEAPKAGALIKINLPSHHKGICALLTAFGSGAAELESYVSTAGETTFTIAVRKAPVAGGQYSWFYLIAPAQQ